MPRIKKVLCLLACVVLATTSCHERSQAPLTQVQVSKPDEQTDLESDTEKSCRQFVQRFYDWYFDRLNAEVTRQSHDPTDYDVLNLKPQVFTPELRRMLREDNEAAAKNPGEIVGLDFDPFINAQDWDGKYWVNSVTVKDITCRASVWGVDSGPKRDIIDPELRFESGKWIFVNFHYPGSTSPADENLIAVLTDLRNERERTKDKKTHK